MDSNKLIERINKAKEKLIKKEILLKKKINKMESIKLKDMPEKYVKCSTLKEIYPELKEMSYSIYRDVESIYDTNNDITELKALISKYKEQLRKQECKENELLNIPKVLLDYKEYLIKTWNENDKQKREYLKQMYNKMGYDAFVKEYKYTNYCFIFRQNEEDDNKINTRDAEVLILNLVKRVKNKVGNITDCKNLCVTVGTHGYSVINGYIEGEKGNCVVESIGAGGYNIQKFHIRVLIK